MRRLARRLFTLCSAVSLVLCVAACVLWVRSYWRADIAEVRGWGLATCRGGLHLWSWETHGYASYVGSQLTTLNGENQDSPDWAWDYEYHLPFPVDFVEKRPERWGFAYTVGRASDPNSPFLGTGEYVRGVSIPLFAVLVALCVLPALSALGWTRAAARRRSGLCASCGYDLRASRERCPECGTAITAPASRAPPG